MDYLRAVSPNETPSRIPRLRERRLTDLARPHVATDPFLAMVSLALCALA